jgi:hypothetical protein
MATTLATEKQAEAIKQRMLEIRTELPYSADHARNRVKELTDWKYYLSKHPVPIAAAVLLAGYMLVPPKRTSERVVERNVDFQSAPVQATPQPAKKGLVGGIVGTLATLALKQGAAIAVTHLSNSLSQKGAS